MNIRKNESKQLLTVKAKRVLHIGMVLIFASLFRLLYDISVSAPFPAAVAEDFGAMLEYPVAALMLLTVLTFLVDRVVRAEKNKKG